MRESTIEHEYPYKHSLVGTSFFLLFFAGVSVVSLLSATERGDIIIDGIVPLRLSGTATVNFRWAVFVGSTLLFAVISKMLWIRVTAPSQRIAFTVEGILLPRSRWATQEEFVRYRDIRNMAFEDYFLHLYGPMGTFSIARQKMTQEAFDEVCHTLLQKVTGSEQLPHCNS